MDIRDSRGLLETYDIVPPPVERKQLDPYNGFISRIPLSKVQQRNCLECRIGGVGGGNGGSGGAPPSRMEI